MKKIICLGMLFLTSLVSVGIPLQAETVPPVSTTDVEQRTYQNTDFSTKKEIDTKDVTKSKSESISFQCLLKLFLLSVFCVLLSIYVLGTLVVILFQPDSYEATLFCCWLSAIIGSAIGTCFVVSNFGEKAGFLFVLLCFCWAIIAVNSWCPDR